MSAGERRPPGWYDDVTDGPLLRYWDGSGWTPHTSSRAACGRMTADAEPHRFEAVLASAERHPLEALGLESTRRIDSAADLTVRPPDASSLADDTTVPTAPGSPGSAPAGVTAVIAPSARIRLVAAAGAITAATSLVVAFAALGVALGR